MLLHTIASARGALTVILRGMNNSESAHSRRGRTSRYLPAIATIAMTFSTICTLSTPNAFAQTQAYEPGNTPDHYNAPAIGRERQELSGAPNEHIDPLSGTLTIAHTDLVLPVQGNLEIAVRRIYQSNSVYVNSANPSYLTGPIPSTLVRRTPTGMGWTMHFGRIRYQNFYDGRTPCSAVPADRASTSDNPILELPNGGQEILLINYAPEGLIDSSDTTNTTSRFITRSQWVGDCINNGTGGIAVTSPDGVRYDMTRRILGGTNPESNFPDTVWYTTRITDVHGNWIAIEYDQQSNGENIRIKKVTSHDGKKLAFTYIGLSDDKFLRLSTISDGRDTWRYGYNPAVDDGYYNLVSVTRPDRTSWKYSYHRKSSFRQAGHRLLKSMTYPTGATVDYDYDFACLLFENCNIAGRHMANIVVATKSQKGPSVENGNWTYEFDRLDEKGNDATIVRGPVADTLYIHFGMKRIINLPGFNNSNAGLWRVGMLLQKQVFTGNAVVHDETYEYEKGLAISNEIYTRPPFDKRNMFQDIPEYGDKKVFLPRLVKKTIVRDGNTYTTEYSDFVDGIHPGTVVEKGSDERTLFYTYLGDGRFGKGKFGKNIVGRVKNEYINTKNDVSRRITRQFDSFGNVINERRYGVNTKYTYHNYGAVSSRTDANGNTINYRAYNSNIPSSEAYPQGITVTRKFDDRGRVTSVTDGRQNTTTYGYDGLGRLKSVKTPRPGAATVSIDYGARTKTVTRGSYVEKITYDGFGREICRTRGAKVSMSKKYDALGRLTFESYPSTGTSCNQTKGTTFVYDIIGRTREVRHPGSKSEWRYAQGDGIGITDEEGNESGLFYRTYGDPDQRELIRSNTEEGISTIIELSDTGQVTRMTQGGVTRRFKYGSNHPFLVSETHPETGTTTFGRDAVGNMTRKKTGTAPEIQYTYDDLYRLVRVDYPAHPVSGLKPAPDVFAYDKSGNRTRARSGSSLKVYSFDANSNLTSERHEIGGEKYSLNHKYNELDHLYTSQYPSEKWISYDPDTLGRAQSVRPFVTSVSWHGNNELAEIRFANGRITSYGLNRRNWVESINNTGNVPDLTYGFDNLANITSITSSNNSQYSSKSMEYDRVSRLTQATGAFGIELFSYDRAGNITGKNVDRRAHSFEYTNQKLTSVSDYASFGYDVWGNITRRISELDSLSMQYDGASRLRTINGNTGNRLRTYSYDADGVRITSRTGAETTHHVKDFRGHVVFEKDPTSDRAKEFAFVGGRIVATRESGLSSPIANAGDDTLYEPGETATLDASASRDRDGDIVRVFWKQIEGPSVEIVDQRATVTSFRTPQIEDSATLKFRVTVVDDDELTSVDYIEITVKRDTPPTVNARANFSVVFPKRFRLRGRASDDGLPNPPARLTTTWRVLESPAETRQPTFSDASLNPLVTVYYPGTYLFLLTADDGRTTVEKELVVTVLDPPPNQAPEITAPMTLNVKNSIRANVEWSVQDEELPFPPGETVTRWSLVNADTNQVTFESGEQKNTGTTVHEFSKPIRARNWGTYPVAITSTDSGLTSEKIVNVRFFPRGQAELKNGVLDRTKYGFQWGNNAHRRGLAMTFPAQTTDVQLHAVGYDIDTNREVKILVNGFFVGRLAKTTDNGFVKTSIRIEQRFLLNDTNVVEFIPRTPGEKWGVKNIRVTPYINTPVPIEIGKTYDGKYGSMWGPSRHQERLVMEFEGREEARDIALFANGFDLSNLEVEVRLNGRRLGFLTATDGREVGPLTRLSALREWVNPGQTNRLEFISKTPGESWGVTNIVLRLGGGAEEAEVELEAGVVNSEGYGHFYEGAERRLLSARFVVNTGARASEIRVRGYDIDRRGEVTVYANGRNIGPLTPGNSNQYSPWTVIQIPDDIVQSEIVRLVFRLKTAYDRWGIFKVVVSPTDVPEQ